MAEATEESQSQKLNESDAHPADRSNPAGLTPDIPNKNSEADYPISVAAPATEVHKTVESHPPTCPAVIEIHDTADDPDSTSAIVNSHECTQKDGTDGTSANVNSQDADGKQKDCDSDKKITTEGDSTEGSPQSTPKTTFLLPLSCVSCETGFSEKTPKLLPCLHSICVGCLEKIETSAEQETGKSQDTNQNQNSCSITCPVCEKSCSMKEVSDNYLVLEHLPVKDSAQRRPSKCTGCEESHDPSSFCSECAEWLCDQCVQAHHRVKITKDHKITPLSQIDASKSALTIKNKDVFNCQIHPHECLRLYCEKCSVVTCRECQLFVHKEHKFSYLHEVGGNLRDIFKTLISRAQVKKTQVVKGIENCEEWRNKIANTEQQLKIEIKTTINKVVSELIRYGKEKEERLGKICNKLRSELDGKKIKILKGLKEINTSINFFQYITENSSDCALVQAKPVLTNNFKSIFTSNIAEYANIKWNLNLKYCHNEDELLQHKHYLGDLLMEAPNGRVEYVRQSSPQTTSPPSANTGSDKGLDSLNRIAKYSGSLTAEQRGLLMKKWAEKHAVSGSGSVSTADTAQQHTQRPIVSLSQIPTVTSTSSHQSIRTAGTFVPLNPFTRPRHPAGIPGNNMFRFHQVENPQGNQMLGTSMFLPHRPAVNQSVVLAQNPCLVNLTSNNTSNPGIVIGQSLPDGQNTLNQQTFHRPPPPSYRNTVTPPQTRTPPPVGRNSISPSSMQSVNQRPSSANSIPCSTQQATRSSDSSPAASDGTPASGVKEEKTNEKSCSQNANKSYTPPPPPAPPSINPRLPDPILAIPSIANSPPPRMESDQLQMSKSYRAPDQELSDPYRLLATLEDPSEDYCACCHNGGDLLCCDQCPKVYHYLCHIPPLSGPPSGEWLCTLCKYKQLKMETPEPINFIPGTNKRKAPTGLSDTEIKICEKMLLELYCHEASVPFHEPVPKTVPSYYKVISHPTDLSTIKVKLSRNHFNHFASMEDFLSEIKLLINNCALFNAPNSEVGKAGIFIAGFFERLVEKIVPCYLDFVKREVTTQQESSDGSSSSTKATRKERRRIKPIIDDDDDESEEETSIIDVG